MIKSLLFVLLLGQAPDDTVKFINPAEILSQGAELEKSGEFEKAVELYLMVSENDTSYMQVQSTLISAYNSLEQYDKSIAIGTKLKDTYSSYRKDIYIDLGNAYLDGGNYEKSRKIYAEGVKLFPYNYILLYNLGLANRRCGDLQEAFSYFQQSAGINPFYSNNHIMLGYLSMLQGHTTKAMLSYLTYMAINPDNNGTLVFLENLAAEAVRSEGSVEPFSDNSEFKHYDELIRSKAALDERFKYEVDFNANIVKQAELLFSKLKFDPNSDDFWMQFYVPFFTRLVQKDLQSAFIYFILKSSDNKDVLSWIEKHDKEKSAWFDIANKALSKNKLKNVTEILGERMAYNHWYFDNKALSAIGNKIDENTRIGPWAFFYQNSQRNAIGKYNQKGLKIGEWLYYHDNGRLSRKEKYDDNGIILEPAIYYHDNGALSIVANYNKKEELDGSLEYYFACGQAREIVPFVAGTKSGKGHHYYETGQVKIDYSMKDGKLDGDYIHYFKNGAIDRKYAYTDGLTNGPYQSYYIDGQLEEEGHYIDDQLSGDWKGYHSDGKLRYKGSLENGNRSGIWEFYHANGNIKEVITYNENGEKHGENKNYTEAGILHSRIVYDKEKIIGLTYFDPKGAILYEALDNEGNMTYETNYATGELLAKGTLKNGKLSGPLTTYFNNGHVRQQANMVDDYYTGLFEEYYSTGELYIKCNYDEGMKNGRYLQFYKNGQINHDGWFVNDEMEQWWQTYYPDGTLDEENYYVSGKINGWNTYYAPGNKLHRAYKYEMDLLTGLKQYDTLGNIFHELEITHGNGIQTRKTVAGDTIFKVNMLCSQFGSDVYSYYGGGKIESKNPLINNLYEGAYEAKRINGNVSVKGAYNNNKQEGLWQWFHSNGNISSEQFYVRGQTEGKSKKYYINGKIESECNYTEDELDGPCQYYDQFDQHQLTKIYDKNFGQIAYVDIKSRDTIQFISKGKFTLESYFPNGNIAVTQNYVDGKFEGENTWYNSDGSVTGKINYLGGDNHGLRTRYYPDGKVFRETLYQYDNKNGTEKEYYDNGQLCRETPYINGNINGYEIIYDRDGRVKSKTYYWNNDVY